ncbi:MAG: hypothetical protein Q8K63_08835 [Acidimicrobiales bacterium]|nr:hypothetical protein [Acidimicrobiales bacterium]
MTTTTGVARSQRESAAIAVFGAWMISGLFLDGWAHDTDRPETFFSPWHGILYSGFAAAVVWFAWDGWRAKREATSVVDAGPADRVVTIGLITFIIGAVGDGLWHEIFGIEVDLEALVSPSHLALLIGGFLMVSSPVRLAAADPTYDGTTWRKWFPQGVTLMLSTALVLFFTQYLSVFETIAALPHNGSDLNEFRAVADLAAILATNAILVIPMLFVLWRWRTPFGAFTLLFGACGLLLSGLEGFELVELVIAFAFGGLIADIVAARNRNPLAVAAVASWAMWLVFFAIADASYGIEWSPELWAGAVVLATASSALLAALTKPPVPVPSLRSADASAG